LDEWDKQQSFSPKTNHTSPSPHVSISVFILINIVPQSVRLRDQDNDGSRKTRVPTWSFPFLSQSLFIFLFNFAHQLHMPPSISHVVYIFDSDSVPFLCLTFWFIFFVYDVFLIVKAYISWVTFFKPNFAC